MNEKAQIEHYLDQKVNPLLEELLTHIIKNRPKNIVKLLLFSSITVEDGFRKRQKICRCSLTCPIVIRTKKIIVLFGLRRGRELINGTSSGEEFVGKFSVVIIFGKTSKCQSFKGSQL